MNLRNLTVTNFISEAEARSVIAKALEGNPSRATKWVGNYGVHFVEVTRNKFTIVSITAATGSVDEVAFAFLDHPKEA